MGLCMFSRLGPLFGILVAAALAYAAEPADPWIKERPADISRFGLTSIELDGDLPVSEADLKDVIRSSTSGLGRFRAVDPDRLEGDAQRLRAHLRRLGYWKAQVELELLFDPARRASRAIFHVAAGAERRVGRITTAGNQAFTEEEVLVGVRQHSGDPFDLSQTDRDRTAIENTYANGGFYEVEVIADIQPAASDTTPVVHDLVYRITEGPRYMVANVRVEGNEFTKSDIIRRELLFRPGDALSREKVDDSRARLYATGYFATVSIVPEKGTRPEAVDVVVRVTERKMRYVGAGIGYGTRDQLRLSGEWGHRNLWGRGKRGSIRGILATELFPVDLVRTRIEGRYVEPWLFGTRTTGSAELSFERREEFFDTGNQKYSLGLVTLLLNASRQLTRHSRGWATLENEWADVDLDPGVELPDDRRPDVTRTFSVTTETDRRSDFFDPKRGFLHRFIGGVSGGLLGGDNDFWRLQVEWQSFRTVRWLTLAGRIRTGYEQPFGESEFVPDRQRFKLGGPTTVRGYDYQEIGPGDFLVLGNVELRFPLFWRLSGGLFVDGGNAWEDAGEVRWKDFRPYDAKNDPDRAAETEMRYAVGGGLRFSTPVGPVRVDVARKTKILPVAPGASDDEKRWGYDFSLGHAF